LMLRHWTQLPLFAMWWALPTSDYYGGSAPRRAYGRRLAYSLWLTFWGEPCVVPKFT
jgi:hypothetical protein